MADKKKKQPARVWVLRVLVVLLDLTAIGCIGYGLRLIYPPLMWLCFGIAAGWLAWCAAKMLE